MTTSAETPVKKDPTGQERSFRSRIIRGTLKVESHTSHPLFVSLAKKEVPSLSNYLSINDFVIFDLMDSWAKQIEGPIGDLSRRLIGRDIFATIVIPDKIQQNVEKSHACFAATRSIVEKAGLKPEIYVIHDTPQDTAYKDFYHYERYKISHQLKPKTISVYDGVMRRCFADWQNKQVTAITKDMVELRHRDLSNAFGPRGKGEAQAHQAMRLLRALFNYAEVILEDASGKPLVAQNPVRRLTQIKAWNIIPRRQTVIHSRDLAKWFRAVNQLQSDTARDFMLLLLFTGLRRGEAATLTWKQIDLDLQTLTISSEVAKNSREHRLPLTDFLSNLLAARRDKHAEQSEYVFPGFNGEGYFKEPKSAINIVIEKSGIKFSCHDLRRTFITIAESLDIPHYALKRLINHTDGGDVTAGYIVTEVERLRAPMQRITDCIRERIGQRNKAAGSKQTGA